MELVNTNRSGLAADFAAAAPSGAGLSDRSWVALIQSEERARWASPLQPGCDVGAGSDSENKATDTRLTRPISGARTGFRSKGSIGPVKAVHEEPVAASGFRKDAIGMIGPMGILLVDSVRKRPNSARGVELLWRAPAAHDSSQHACSSSAPPEGRDARETDGYC